MHAARKSPQATQLKLFQPAMQSPQWLQLPLEIRQQTVRLLAQLLCAHAARRSRPAGGAGDE